MDRKLTITISEEAYEGLQRTVGIDRIGQFLEKLGRSRVLPEDIEAAYRDMAADEAREFEAHRWSEALIGDVSGDHPDAAR
jgi:predicted CopG family antitoxin